ncbi:MAG TPA: hypothetical protein VFF60_07470 [Candidatus Binatus sp.]|nr:hypothetical protein [Candidatus Binatus sp.]
MAERLLALSVAVALAALASTTDASAASAPTGAVAKTLAKYRTMMATLVQPRNMVFEYSEVRTGPTRMISTVHRVYRNQAGEQRNDTISIDDSKLRPPHTQTYKRATWPYAADQFAVMAADYEATFAGLAVVNGRKAYMYDTKRTSPGPFAVIQLALDPSTGMPLRVRYIASSSDCDGTGEIDFMQVGQYILPSVVAAQCTIAGSGEFRHVIRFSNFSFPAVIPQDVLHPAGAS